MKRFVLIILLVSSAPVADQLVAYSRPLEPGFRLPQVTQFEPTQSSESFRKSSDELAAAALERPAPEYPALARAARITGKVEVEVVIDPRGNVVDARSISGHPLLKDAAVASVRHWKFNAAKLSQGTTNVIGTVTVIFDLEAEKREKTLLAHPDSEWAANTRICRDEIAKASPDARKLALALATLAVSAINENRADEAIGLFEETGRQDKLPPEARPYYAKLLLTKHDHDLERELEKDGKPLTTMPDGYLTRALQLFVQAYADESQAKPVDTRKLVDIGRYIGRVYVSMGKPEERMAWMRIMLSSSLLPDRLRAEISFEMAVILWKKSYDITAEYVRQNKPVAAEEIPKIREFVDEGYLLIHSAQALAPTFANSWFYEKLLIIEELKTETDPTRQELLIRRAMEAQDRYTIVQRSESTRGVEANYRRPYASGLPSLNSEPTPPPPPPPPAPPPPPRAPRSGNKS